jgi:vacuolar-type H+-ATPase subunit F/Vma7
MENLKVGMLGDWSSTMGFKAVGLQIHAASSKDEIVRLWEAMRGESYAIVIMTEPVFEALLEMEEDFPPREGLPVVLAVPAASGSTGIASSMVRERVIKALGSVVEA